MNIKKKKVLITGADGFIGSHLVEQLLIEEYHVTAFVYYNSFNSWGWIDSIPHEIKKNLTVISGDIRDFHSIKNAMIDCEIVFHLAALIAIPFSYVAPDSYIDTNVKGTLNILQAARELNIGRVLITSTSEVYGTAIYVPIDEKHTKQAQSPYSATKIAADALAESFYKSFSTPITIVRPFNTYGPRQSARAVIPTIISQLFNGATEIRLGDLTPTRDLLFVKDTVKGFIEISKSIELIGHECNIATQSEITVKDLCIEIINQINPKATIVCDDTRLRPKGSEVYRLYGSNEKIKKYTNWDLTYTLKTGLKETINWFSNQDNLNKYKHNIYNI